MTGWIILAIIAGLLLLIMVLLCCSVKAHIEYNTKKCPDDFYIKAKYLFITLYDSTKPPKPPKPKKQKKQKKTKNKKQNQKSKPQKSITEKVEQIKQDTGLSQVADDVKKANKRSFDFEMYKLIYDSAKSPVKRLIQKTRITNFNLTCIVAGDNAAKVALAYGFQSAAISAGLAWLNEILKLKIKKVNVTADFSKEETEFNFKFKAKIRVGTAVICLLQYIKNANKNNK